VLRFVCISTLNQPLDGFRSLPRSLPRSSLPPPSLSSLSLSLSSSSSSSLSSLLLLVVAVVSSPSCHSRRQEIRRCVVCHRGWSLRLSISLREQYFFVYDVANTFSIVPW